MKQHLLEEYAQARPALLALEVRLLEALDQLLLSRELSIHSLSSRIKAPDSLARKLNRPDRTYHALGDVTDLVAARIITYFEDSIDVIAALIEKHFIVDYDHSIDKRKSLDASRFGYRSLHYVCRLSPDDIWPFEIQIRTILQHAWAETEHDLGYKSEASIPLEIRRRFSRVASLLEVADEELVSIRRFLGDYEQGIQQRLQDPEASVRLDGISLEQFLKDPDVLQTEQQFAELIGVPLSDSPFYPDYLLRMLAAAEITDLAELREALLGHRTSLEAFIKPYFAFTRRTWNFTGRDLGAFLRGYSLVFLAHYLLLKDVTLDLVKLERLTRFYQAVDYPDDEMSARAVAKNLVESLGGED